MSGRKCEQIALKSHFPPDNHDVSALLSASFRTGIGAIWQYPSTGNEHQVGKDYPPEEQAWNRLATYVNAAQALATRKAGNTMLPAFFAFEGATVPQCLCTLGGHPVFEGATGATRVPLCQSSATMKRNRAKAAAERERLVDAQILSRIQNFSGWKA